MLFHIIFHYGLLQDIEYGSLWYTVGPCCLHMNILTYSHVLETKIWASLRGRTFYLHTHFMHVCMLSCVWLFATPWTIACQASLSMGFSRQEYWSGLPFPTPPYFINISFCRWENKNGSLTVLLEETHWLKLPTLAGHHSNHLHELFYGRRSW